MATVGQFYYNVLDTNTGDYITSKGSDGATSINIYEDVLAQIGVTQLNRIGIQAPAGTKVIFNSGAKEIIIGRNGMYELDDDVVISSLYFVRSPRYVRDVDAEAEKIAAGYAGMSAAETYRRWALGKLSITDSDYWTKYMQIEDNYNYGCTYTADTGGQVTIIGYQAALNLYNEGAQGIYKLPDTGDKYYELYNIIVDYIIN